MTEGEMYCRKVQVANKTGAISIVLPRKMCNDLEIEKGDYIKVSLKGKTVIIPK